MSFTPPGNVSQPSLTLSLTPCRHLGTPSATSFTPQVMSLTPRQRFSPIGNVLPLINALANISHPLSNVSHPSSTSQHPLVDVLPLMSLHPLSTTPHPLPLVPFCSLVMSCSCFDQYSSFLNHSYSGIPWIIRNGSKLILRKWIIINKKVIKSDNLK